jgi:hypothetical protein
MMFLPLASVYLGREIDNQKNTPYINYKLKNTKKNISVSFYQGCGSGLDPDSYWESRSRIRIQGQEN